MTQTNVVNEGPFNDLRGNLKVLVGGCPVIVGLIVMGFLGYLAGLKLASAMEINPSLPIDSQVGAGHFMMLLMFIISLLFILGWAIGYAIIILILSIKSRLNIVEIKRAIFNRRFPSSWLENVTQNS